MLGRLKRDRTRTTTGDHGGVFEPPHLPSRWRLFDRFVERKLQTAVLYVTWFSLTFIFPQYFVERGMSPWWAVPIGLLSSVFFAVGFFFLPDVFPRHAFNAEDFPTRSRNVFTALLAVALIVFLVPLGGWAPYLRYVLVYLRALWPG